MALVYNRYGTVIFGRPTRKGGTMYVVADPQAGAVFEVCGRTLRRLLPALKRGGWEAMERARARMARDTDDAWRWEGPDSALRLPHALRAWVEWLSRGRSRHFRREIGRRIGGRFNLW